MERKEHEIRGTIYDFQSVGKVSGKEADIMTKFSSLLPIRLPIYEPRILQDDKGKSFLNFYKGDQGPFVILTFEELPKGRLEVWAYFMSEELKKIFRPEMDTIITRPRVIEREKDRAFDIKLGTYMCHLTIEKSYTFRILYLIVGTFIVLLTIGLIVTVGSIITQVLLGAIVAPSLRFVMTIFGNVIIFLLVMVMVIVLLLWLRHAIIRLTEAGEKGFLKRDAILSDRDTIIVHEGGLDLPQSNTILHWDQVKSIDHEKGGILIKRTDGEVEKVPKKVYGRANLRRFHKITTELLDGSKGTGKAKTVGKKKEPEEIGDTWPVFK